MTTETDSNGRTVTDERILEFIRAHQDPCVTAGEIADEFKITNEGANYRLKKIRDRGEVVEKRVGVSAKVWYVRE